MRGDSAWTRRAVAPIRRDASLMGVRRRTDPSSRWWFVTRKYPPAIGGMERLSFEVTTRLARRRPATVIAKSCSRPGLPGFVAASALRVLDGCLRRRISLLHVGDPVLAPLGAIARAFGVPTVVTIHGLDVVHAQAIYRPYRRAFLRGFDAYVCISRAARDAAVVAGVPSERIEVIGIGVDASSSRPAGVVRDDARLLFVGRLVERKGLGWFVRDVLPRVAATRPSLRLAIVGDGPERERIAAAARAAGVAERLEWLDAVGDDIKAKELDRATLCIMPNLPIGGDIEGFGIVALEAAAAACPLVAADLEGLSDALADGCTGRRVVPGDADAWVRAIDDALGDPAACKRAGEAARDHVRRHCAWEGVIDQYERLFARLDREAAKR